MELAIGPFFDVFDDVLKVVFCVDFEKFFALGVYDADFAVVKVDFIVFVYGAHVVGGHGVGLAFYHVHVLAVAQHDVVEEFEAELGEVTAGGGHGRDFLAFLFA